MTGLEEIILAFAMFAVKHFVFDFLYQPPFQWKNKGIYGHPGGIVHALQHLLGTLPILLYLQATPTVILQALLLEFLVHYHMDWAKMRINAKMNWSCNKHNAFWILTGFDQLVHYLTYVAILILVV